MPRGRRTSLGGRYEGDLGWEERPLIRSTMPPSPERRRMRREMPAWAVGRKMSDVRFLMDEGESVTWVRKLG